jgi:hypothetical protein
MTEETEAIDPDDLPEKAFVVWHGGNYEVFECTEDAEHEMMAMQSRGLRGWNTTNFDEILDDASLSYDARFRPIRVAPAHLDISDEKWFGWKIESPVSDRHALLYVINEDYHALHWVTGKDKVHDIKPIDISEIRAYLHAFMLQDISKGILKKLADLIDSAYARDSYGSRTAATMNPEVVCRRFLEMEDEIVAAIKAQT